MSRAIYGMKKDYIQAIKETREIYVERMEGEVPSSKRDESARRVKSAISNWKHISRVIRTHFPGGDPDTNQRVGGKKKKIKNTSYNCFWVVWQGKSKDQAGGDKKPGKEGRISGRETRAKRKKVGVGSAGESPPKSFRKKLN